MHLEYDMKEELLKVIDEFRTAVDAHNMKRHEKELTDFEDDVEYSFESFIKWLDFEYRKSPPCQ